MTPNVRRQVQTDPVLFCSDSELVRTRNCLAMLVWCCAKANKLWAYQVRHSATENPLCVLWIRIASCSQPQSWHRETQVCFFMYVEIGSGTELLAVPFLFCLNTGIFCYRTRSGPTPKQRWWMFLSKILQGQVTGQYPPTIKGPGLCLVLPLLGGSQ